VIFKAVAMTTIGYLFVGIYKDTLSKRLSF